MSGDNGHAFFLTMDAGNRSPNRRRSKYHGVRRLEVDGTLVTACGGLRVADWTPLEAADIPEFNRCRAQGCRQLFAKAVDS